MFDNRIDLPNESLKKEGNVWLNKRNKQLRTSLGENEPTLWFNSISVYEVGSNTKIKKGQPVSVGYLDQLHNNSKAAGDACIVQTNPSINQWCIGLALEPGEHRSGNTVDKIHVQSSGQFEYLLSNLNNSNYYMPPNNGTKFTWTYNDIGKPVYVSNKNVGELTLDLADATYNGGTIICVGRIADAPLGTETNINQQKIVIEVQVSGDTRGVIDTSQVRVDIASNEEHATMGIDLAEIDSTKDRVFFLFVKDSKAYFILDDGVVNRNSKTAPLGAIVVKPVSNKIDLTALCGKSILICRLGLLRGDFGFTKIGNTAYLSNGFIDESASSSSYEYKVGIILDTDKILIDCRYPRFIAKKSMLGDIKPLFENGLTEPGYAKIDNNVHKVIFDRNDSTCADGIDWKDLVESIYIKDILVFSKNKNGTFTSFVDGNWTLDSLPSSNGIFTNSTYFKFKDLIYKFGDGSCGCQIKYAKDDLPEAMNYVWPEQTFQLSLQPAAGRENDEDYVVGGDSSSSRLKLNISKLVNVGAYLDAENHNIEAYDIIVREKTTNQLISPGFYQIEDPNTHTMKWCGYEWVITNDVTTKQTFITMITVPNNTIAVNKCLGFCWPIGNKITQKVDLYVTVRKRPTQYHELYLNQLNQNNPWAPHTDGNNLITGNAIYFGAHLRETPPDSGIGQNSGYNREDIGTAAITVDSSNNEATITTIVSEQTSNDNDKINVLYDIKAIATRSNNDNFRKWITWTYDFRDNVTSLSSAFAPDVVQKSTAINNLYEDKTLFNEKDALKVLHEFKVYNLNYKDDSPNVITNWKKLSYFYDEILQAKTRDSSYNIFDFESDLDGCSYSIDQTLKDKISNVIKNLYGTSNGYLSFISNIGLLNAAANDIQNRLLKIERSIFGKDFSTNPGGVVNGDDTYSEISNTISNYGLLRDVATLKDLNIIIEKTIPSDKYPEIKNGHTSILNEFFTANYTEYLSEQQFNSNLRSFKLQDFETSAQNNLKTLWIDFKNRQGIDYQLSGKNNLFQNYFKYTKSVDNDFINDEFIFESSTIEAAKIVLRKYKQKYLFENKSVVNYSTDTGKAIYEGSLLKWPLFTDNDFKNFNYYDIFINDGYCGLDDSTSLDQAPSFNPFSLEGLVLDIYVKLSYIKSKFLLDGTIKQSFFDYYSDFKYITGTNHLDIKTLPRENEDGIYSAFSLKNNKILDLYSTVLKNSNKKPVITTEGISGLLEYKDNGNLGNYYNYNVKGLNLYNYNNFFAYFIFIELHRLYNLIEFLEENSSSLESATSIESKNRIRTAFNKLSIDITVGNNSNFRKLFAKESISADLDDNGLPVITNSYDGYLKSELSSILIRSQWSSQYNVISAYINSAPSTYNSEFLSTIKNKPTSKLLDAAEFLFPSFENTINSLKLISGSNQEEYEKHCLVFDIMYDTFVYNTLTTNTLIKHYYINTRDGDQKPLTDESNNINNFINTAIQKENNVALNNINFIHHLEKIDDSQNDIILDYVKKEYIKLNHDSISGEVKKLLVLNADALNTVNNFYDETEFKFGSVDFSKTGSIWLGITSLKAQINNYHELLKQNNAIIQQAISNSDATIDIPSLSGVTATSHTDSDTFEIANGSVSYKSDGTVTKVTNQEGSVTSTEKTMHKDEIILQHSFNFNKSTENLDHSHEYHDSENATQTRTLSHTVDYGNENSTTERTISFGDNTDDLSIKFTPSELSHEQVTLPAKDLAIENYDATVDVSHNHNVSIDDFEVQIDLSGATFNLNIGEDTVEASFAEGSTIRQTISIPDENIIVEEYSGTKNINFTNTPKAKWPSTNITVPKHTISDKTITIGNKTIKLPKINIDNHTVNYPKIVQHQKTIDYPVLTIDDHNKFDLPDGKYTTIDEIITKDQTYTHDPVNVDLPVLNVTTEAVTDGTNINEFRRDLANITFIKDENLNTLSELNLESKAANNDGLVNLEVKRNGTSCTFKEIYAQEEDFVNDVFNNQSINRTFDKVELATDDSTNITTTTFSKNNANISNISFDTYPFRTTQNNFEGFWLRINTYSGYMDSMYNGSQILKSKLKFIFELQPDLKLWTGGVGDLDAIRSGIDTVYKAALAAYNIALQNSLKTTIKTKPTFKEFYLYGQQQKRPNTSVILSGNVLQKSLDIDYVAHKANLSDNLYKEIPSWVSELNPYLIRYSLKDEFNRSFYLKIDNDDYVINSFDIYIFTLSDRNNLKDLFFNAGIMSTKIQYYNLDTVHKNYIIVPNIYKVRPEGYSSEIIEDGDESFKYDDGYHSLNSLPLNLGISIGKIPTFKDTIIEDPETGDIRFFSYPNDYCFSLGNTSSNVETIVNFESYIDLFNGSKAVDLGRYLVKNQTDMYTLLNINLDNVYDFEESIKIKSLDFSHAELR